MHHLSLIVAADGGDADDGNDEILLTNYSFINLIS